MNRFLKKEWDDSRISESELLQVRNQAWSRFHAKPARRRRWGWLALASGLAAVVLWIARPLDPAAPSTEPTPARLAQISKPGAPAPPQAPIERPADNGKAVAEVSPKRKKPSPPSTRKAVNREEAGDLNQDHAPSQSTRLVLNFQLPDSGVRMIWVQTADFFQNEGDTQ